jgi:hypothetical protein
VSDGTAGAPDPTTPEKATAAAVAATRRAHVPDGSTVIPIRLFDAPDLEVQRALSPPWPHWMKQLYALQRMGSPDVDPDSGEVPLGSAIRAVSSRLHHRLELIAWVVGALSESGWECVVSHGHVLAHRAIEPSTARDELEREGVYGPMTNVCPLDEHGRPLMLEVGKTAHR